MDYSMKNSDLIVRTLGLLNFLIPSMVRGKNSAQMVLHKCLYFFFTNNVYVGIFAWIHVELSRLLVVVPSSCNLMFF